MKKLLLLISLFAFLAIITVTNAESLRKYYRFGVYGDFQYNFHTADYVQLNECPTCGGHYKTGDGLGAAIGALFEIPLNKTFAIGARLSYAIDNATLKKTESIPINYNNKIYTATAEQSLDASLGSIALAPLFSIRLIDWLQFHLGFRFGFPVVANYDSKETLTDPPNGTFENGFRTRNVASGSITSKSALWASFMAGVSYEFPLNRKQTVFLAPEAFLLLGLTNISKDVDWKPNSLRIGLALKFAPSTTHHSSDYKVDTVTRRSNRYTIPTMIEGDEFTSERTEYLGNNEKVIVKEIHRTDTLFTPALSAKLVTTAIAEDGTRGKVSDIHVSTQFVTEFFPVTPYVFFGKNSSQLPSRYNQLSDSKEFSFAKMDNNPVAIQRQILNIIGKRMSENPNTTITLLGAADPTSENSDCNLAQNRAQVVKNYLVNTWGIAEDRIKIKQLKEPCSPSAITKSDNEAGYADNRRVEIYSNDKELLSSIPSQRYNEPYRITPPVIEHDPTGSTSEDVANWVLVGAQGSNEIFTKSGTGAPVKIEHKISNQAAMELRDDMPLQLTYVIKDKSGNTATATEEFNVTKDTSNVEVKRLSLTVFNVGSAEVTKSAGEQIKDFMATINPGSEITITGYTDQLGDENFNLTLSRNRANSIKEYVQKLLPDANIKSTKGVAFSSFPPGIYSYSTPEERFLSRTVQIEVRNKLK